MHQVDEVPWQHGAHLARHQSPLLVCQQDDLQRKGQLHIQVSSSEHPVSARAALPSNAHRAELVSAHMGISTADVQLGSMAVGMHLDHRLHAANSDLHLVRALPDRKVVQRLPELLSNPHWFGKSRITPRQSAHPQSLMAKAHRSTKATYRRHRQDVPSHCKKKKLMLQPFWLLAEICSLPMGSSTASVTPWDGAVQFRPACCEEHPMVCSLPMGSPTVAATSWARVTELRPFCC